jgi:hypothetical protein
MSIRDVEHEPESVKLKHLDRAASFDQRKFVPLLTQSLNDVYHSGRHLEIQPTNIKHIHDLCYDPLTRQVWGITESVNNNYFFHINHEDGTYGTVLIGAPNTNKGMAGCYALKYIWFAIIETPARILRVNPLDDTFTFFDMPAGTNRGTSICTDGTYVYMGTDQTPARIVRFNPADNTTTIYTMAAGENQIYWMLFDGTYVWAAGGTPGTNTLLIRFDPATGLHVTYNLGAAHTSPHHICFDGNYIWVLNAGTNTVVKFDIDTGTIVDYLNITQYTCPYNCEFDGKFVWVATTSRYLIRISPEDMSYEVMRPPLHDNYIHAICFDGSHLWVGTWSDPAYVYKFTPWLGSQGKGILRFDGNQTSLAAGTTRYVGTLGLSAAENVTQIPIGDNINVLVLALYIITNTLNSITGISMRRNGVDEGNYIVIPAGGTGYRFAVQEPRATKFRQGDLLSIRVWADPGAGTIEIGQITIITQ